MNKPKSLKLGPWYKGVRYDAPPEELDEHELSGGSNFIIGDRGQLKKRPGFQPASYLDFYGNEDPSIRYVSQSAINDEGPVKLIANLTLDGTYDTTQTFDYVLIASGDTFYVWNTYGWSEILDIEDEDVHWEGEPAWTGEGCSFPVDGEYYSWCKARSHIIGCNGHAPFKMSSLYDLSVCDVDSRFDTARFVAWWDNRAWFAHVTNVDGETTTTHANRVWYSDPLAIETYQATSYYNIGEPILGLSAMREQLVIHAKNSIWTIKPTGNDTIPYELTELKMQGCVAHRASQVIPGGHLFMVRTDGCFTWDGTDEGGIKKVSQALDYGYWPSVNKEMLADAHSVFYAEKNQVWLWLPYNIDRVVDPGTIPATVKPNTCNHLMIFEGYTDPDGSDGFRWIGPHEGSASTFSSYRSCSCIVKGKPFASYCDQEDETAVMLYEHDAGMVDVIDPVDPDDGSVYASENIKMWAITATASPEGDDEGGTYRWLFARHAFDTDLEYTFGVEQTGEAVRFISMWKLETFTPDGGFVLDDEELDVGDLGDAGPFYVESPLTGYASNAGVKYSEDSYTGGVTFWSVRLYYHDLSTSRRYRGAS